ncbi:MAG: hypothetical protein IT532_12960 [Burkholderiales bacterium]|nr:hypothetical protein [Burkholderiales bacterium]
MLTFTVEYLASSAAADTSAGSGAAGPEPGAASPEFGTAGPESVSAHLWSADGSAAQSEAVAARNDAICARLREDLPGLSPAKDRDDYVELCADDGLSQEQVLRRYHRMRALTAPWRDGELRLELYDRIALLHAPVSARDARRRPDYAAALEALISLVARASGMAPRMPGESRSAGAGETAAALMAGADGALTQLDRRERRSRLQQQLGLPSLAVLAVLALLGTLLLLWHGIERGTLMAGADPQAPATFLAQSAPAPHYVFGMFPAFTLHGRIAETGEAVELGVFREQYIRAGPGAPFSVLRTGDPASPWVLRAAYDSASPVLRIGSIGLAWHTWLAAVPGAAFFFWVLRPLQRAPLSQRPWQLAAVTAKLRFVLLFAAAVAAVVLGKRLL